MESLLNSPPDTSLDFHQAENEYYLPGEFLSFDAAAGKGKLQWHYHRWIYDWFFNRIAKHLQKQEERSTPFQDYETNPAYDFSISFVNENTVRLRVASSSQYPAEKTIMLRDGFREGKQWEKKTEKDLVSYSSSKASVSINTAQFEIAFINKDGRPLTATHSQDIMQGMFSRQYPLLFMRRASDHSRRMAVSFKLHPDEKIYGCGESFTSFNKRGQKLVLATTDTQSTATGEMYKPVPFFISSRGYGMFIHSSCPMTLDFGHTHDGCQSFFLGEGNADIFFFIGTPKEILTSYSNVTGKSPLPPLWSFGLWMSRMSYQSQHEVWDVADKLRSHKIPCDVIHIDAGWFEKGINCDFRFCNKNFPEPAVMISSLKENGFRTTLWQIPYFTPKNPIYQEVIERELYIKDGGGNLPTEDAILDFSNESTREWYSSKIKALFDLGIAAIKADFGEAAPYNGVYASGLSGWHEHNLYPLRYTQLVHEITRKCTNEDIIWARSAWAGGQRCGVHWGGDAEVSDAGMSGSLRGGLSLGLSGFSFWSHDMGGFSGVPSEELYLRWAFFGLLSSHSRAHGFPPREPWHFSSEFVNKFRELCELRYSLLPYIYTQAYISSQNGWPLMRALLLEYPDDPIAALIDNQYLLGDALMVAPLMETGTRGRNVYLPEGNWVDYHSKNIFEGQRNHYMHASVLPGILLVKSGSIIPTAEIAQHTGAIDWQKIQFAKISDSDTKAIGQFYNPQTKELKTINNV